MRGALWDTVGGWGHSERLGGTVVSWNGTVEAEGSQETWGTEAHCGSLGGNMGPGRHRDR